MSVSVEALRKLNLNDEQIAQLQQLQASVASPQAKGRPSMSKSTDQAYSLASLINAAKAGDANGRFSTDPISRSSFLATGSGEGQGSSIGGNFLSKINRLSRKLTQKDVEPYAGLSRPKSFNDLISMGKFNVDGAAMPVQEKYACSADELGRSYVPAEHTSPQDYSESSLKSPPVVNMWPPADISTTKAASRRQSKGKIFSSQHRKDSRQDDSLLSWDQDPAPKVKKNFQSKTKLPPVDAPPIRKKSYQSVPKENIQKIKSIVETAPKPSENIQKSSDVVHEASIKPPVHVEIGTHSKPNLDLFDDLLSDLQSMIITQPRLSEAVESTKYAPKSTNTSEKDAIVVVKSGDEEIVFTRPQVQVEDTDVLKESPAVESEPTNNSPLLDLLSIVTEHQKATPLDKKIENQATSPKLLSPKTNYSANNLISPLSSPLTQQCSLLGRPEYASLPIDTDGTCQVADLIAIREEIDAADHLLFSNYKACLNLQKTCLPISFPELKQRIAMAGGEILLDDECPDPKHLLLVPLNLTTVPRWIPPGSRFRIGRSSNWFLSPSRVVSRNHCEIFHDIDQYYLSDVGSHSGTFVNGQRLSPDGHISDLRLLQHWDIIQVGVDYSSEMDPLGNLENTYKSAQAVVLLGYPIKATVQLRQDLLDIGSHRKCIEQPTPTMIKANKLKNLESKAKSQKSKLVGSNIRLYVEFGDLIHDNTAGIAIVLRDSTEESPSYSAVFNNYKLSWEIGLTRGSDGKLFLLKLAPKSTKVFQIRSGRGIVGYITVSGKNKLTVEPISQPNQFALGDDLPDAEIPNTARRYMLDEAVGGGEEGEHHLEIPSNLASPYIVLDSPLSGHYGHLPSANPTSYSTKSAAASTDAPISPILDGENEESQPYYTLTGDMSTGMIFYIRRTRGSREQKFLGEGQLGQRKSKWGKKCIFYEARLPPPPEHDELLMMASLFAVLHNMDPS